MKQNDNNMDKSINTYMKPRKNKVGTSVKKTKNTVVPSVTPVENVTPVTPVQNKTVDSILDNNLIENIVKSITEIATKPTSAPLKKKTLQQEDVDRIKNVLSEYLNSYMIIGYTAENNRVVLKHAKNHQDEDSLVEFLRVVLMSIVGPQF